MTKLLLLDKDGTLVRPKSGGEFVQHPEDQELLPGVAETIERYAADGWTMAIVSNQGGVSAGYKTLEDAISEMRHCMGLLPQIETAYFCPNGEPKWWHRLARILGYSTRCVRVPRNAQKEIVYFESHCDEEMVLWTGSQWGRPISYRKPSGLMPFLAAIESVYPCGTKWPDKILMIGDRPEDQQAAEAANIPFMWAHEWIKTGT